MRHFPHRGQSYLSGRPAVCSNPNDQGCRRCLVAKRRAGRSRMVPRAMFDEMEAFTNLLSPGVASVVTAVIAVTSVSINLYGGLLTERKRADLAKQVERERQAAMQMKEMRSLVARYRGPLLEAAVDLESRLMAVATGRTARGGGRGVVEEEVIYTLFTLSQFLGFVELVRREGPRERSFLQQGNPQGTDTLANLLEGFRFIMCAHPSALQAWYDEGDHRDHPGARSRKGVPYGDIGRSQEVAKDGGGMATENGNKRGWLGFGAVMNPDSGTYGSSNISSSSSSNNNSIDVFTRNSSSTNNGNGVLSVGSDDRSTTVNGNGNNGNSCPINTSYVIDSTSNSSSSSSNDDGDSTNNNRNGGDVSSSSSNGRHGGGVQSAQWLGGNVLHMSRGTQRAVGSLMIITPVGASRHYTLSYSDFYRRFYCDESFAAWLQPMFQDLVWLIGTPGGWPGCAPFPVNPWSRLLLLQQLLVDTIDLLDPFMVRTTQQHRWRLAPIPYAPLPNAESYKERLRVLESLADTAMPSMNSVFLRAGWARSARDGASNEYLGSNEKIMEKLYYVYPSSVTPPTSSLAAGGGSGGGGSGGGTAGFRDMPNNPAAAAYERGLAGLPYGSMDEDEQVIGMPYYNVGGWRPVRGPSVGTGGGGGGGGGWQQSATPGSAPAPSSLPVQAQGRLAGWQVEPAAEDGTGLLGMTSPAVEDDTTEPLVPYIPPPNTLVDRSELPQWQWGPTQRRQG